MEGSAVLVTSDGSRVLSESDDFFAMLSALAPGRDAARFAVNNLGFIRFAALDAEVTGIELHPARVERRALLRAERRVAEFAASHFRITFLDTGRRTGLLSPAATLASLSALRVSARRPVRQDA